MNQKIHPLVLKKIVLPSISLILILMFVFCGSATKEYTFVSAVMQSTLKCKVNKYNNTKQREISFFVELAGRGEMTGPGCLRGREEVLECDPE
jgi:hypothetical protein